MTVLETKSVLRNEVGDLPPVLCFCCYCEFFIRLYDRSSDIQGLVLHRLITQTPHCTWSDNTVAKFLYNPIKCAYIEETLQMKIYTEQ